MNRIFSVLLSLQLMVAPLTVAAESNNKTETKTTTSKTSSNSSQNPQDQSKAAASETISKGMTEAENSQSNPKYESESQHQGGFGFYSKQVLAISTSIIGGSIIEQCALGAKIPSIIAFMAGSLIYIASEFAGAKAQKDDHNRRIETIKSIEERLKSQGGEVQREMLTQRLKEEIAVRDYFIQKRNWMIAVTAVYFTAMALAISEETSGIAAGLAMGTMICAGLAAAYAAGCGPKYPACYAAHFAACQGLAPIGWATIMPNFANPAAPMVAYTTCAGATQYAPGCIGYTSAYLGIAWAGCQPLPGVSGMIVAKALSIVYSTGLTRTSGSQATSYVVMLAGLLQFFVPSLQSMVVAAYNFPIPRSITFGISAALATAVTAGYQSRISVAEENIAKLQKLLDHYRGQTDDDTTLGADVAQTPDVPAEAEGSKSVEFKGINNKNGSSAASTSSITKGEIIGLNKGTSSTNKSRFCISNAGGSVEYSEKACGSPLKVNRPTFNVSGSGSQTLKDAGNLTVDMAQAVSDGDFDKANVIAGNLGALSSKVKDIAINYQNERNEILKKAGIKTESGELVDYQEQMNQQIAAIQSSMVKEAQKHKLNITAADLNLNSGTASVSEKTKSQDGMNIQTVASNNVEAIKSDITPEPAMEALDEKSLLADYKEDSSGAGLPAGLTEEGLDSLLSQQNSGKVTEDNPYGLTEDALRAARANGYYDIENNLKRYGIEDEGISGLSDVSLFKQISTRYFMNYSKMAIRRPKPAAR